MLPCNTDTKPAHSKLPSSPSYVNESMHVFWVWFFCCSKRQRLHTPGVVLQLLQHQFPTLLYLLCWNLQFLWSLESIIILFSYWNIKPRQGAVALQEPIQYCEQRKGVIIPNSRTSGVTK